MIPQSAFPVMMSSIASSTKSQYTSSWRAWWSYCDKQKCDFYNVKEGHFLQFLSDCFNNGSNYGTLNSHRSAIAFISTHKIDSDKINRFFKGVYRLKPIFPKYIGTWDPNIVLNYYAALPNDHIMNLEHLTRKLVILLALSTGQRLQTLSMIKLDNIQKLNDRILIKITDIIKTSGIGRSQPILNLPFFISNPKICPAATLLSYIELTSCHRSPQNNALLLTFKKPFRPASTQTLGRWIKKTLAECGVDTSIFTAHSTRHASTSAAYRSGISFDVIRKTAGWSAQSSVFANYYNRPIVQDSNTSLISNV